MTDLKRVYVAAGAYEAQFLVNLLQSEGIKAEIMGEELPAGLGHLPAESLQPELFTLASQADAARKILEEYENPEAATPSGR